MPTLLHQHPLPLPHRLPASSTLPSHGSLHVLVYLLSCLPMTIIFEPRLKHSSHLKVRKVVFGLHESVSSEPGSPDVCILNKTVPCSLELSLSFITWISHPMWTKNSLIQFSQPCGFLHTSVLITAHPTLKNMFKGQVMYRWSVSEDSEKSQISLHTREITQRRSTICTQWMRLPRSSTSKIGKHDQDLASRSYYSTPALKTSHMCKFCPLKFPVFVKLAEFTKESKFPTVIQWDSVEL